ncbi:MAG: hypothetical protein EA359_15505 [Balneolaceae bacterium]|nr:MAG: hypothetical protein EA359_15505 [Balneolaceae bacterium]
MKSAYRLSFFIILLFLFITCEQERQQPVYLYTMNNPADTGSQFPNLYKDAEGNIFMSWVMLIDEEIAAMQYAVFSDGRWGPARTVRVATDFFINWADFPSVVGMDGEPVAAHWLKKIEGGPYAYNVEIGFPENDTRRWTNIITPHLDGTPTEHGFVSIEPLSNNRVLAIWLDGRNTDGRGHHEYEDISKAMTLRSAEISSAGEITRKNEIDAVVCDCCQTDLAAVEGGYLAVYRGRTDDEIRDILISRYNIETGEWSEPVFVHQDGWQIMACPVNGPRISVNGENVAIAWYTESEEVRKVLLARSSDSGRTFGDPIIIANDENQTLGRTDLILTDDGSVYVSWLQQRGQFGNVMISHVRPNGSIGNTINVGLTSSSRTSGFPRMEHADKHIMIAWTQTEPFVRVRTARVGLDQF